MSSWGIASDASRADGHETAGPGDAGDAGTAGDAAEAEDRRDAGDATPVDEAGDADGAGDVADVADVDAADDADDRDADDADARDADDADAADEAARAADDAADAGEAGDGSTPPHGEPSVATPVPADRLPATAALVGPVSSDDPAPVGDSLPSTESLRWAPDPTVPLPSEAPDPTVPMPGPVIPGAYSGQPGPLGSPAYSGQPGSPIPRTDPWSPGPPAHLAPRPRSAGRHGAWRRWRADPVALGAIGALVAIVVVAGILITRDGKDPADPEESATPSLVAGDGSDPAGPIVGPTGVIGSWSGSEWVPRPDGEQPGAGLDYTVLGLGDAVGTARGEAVAEDCPAQRASSEVDVGVALDGGAGGGPPPVAVAGVAEPRPRAIEQLGTDSEVYRQAAADVGADLGATTPPTVTAVLRADLDGNGTDEVVVAAEHISDPEDLSPAAGDWSVVFLRRVVGNDVATDVLASSVVGGDGGRLDRIQVATLADLNGDGTMEVALDGRSSTGEWTSIHALGGDGVPSEVLRAGCDG